MYCCPLNSWTVYSLINRKTAEVLEGGDLWGGAFALSFLHTPGIWTAYVSPPWDICPFFFSKKISNARSLARGEWALLELTARCIIGTRQPCVANICNAIPRANVHKLLNDSFTISSSVLWTHLHPRNKRSRITCLGRKETKVHVSIGVSKSEK